MDADNLATLNQKQYLFNYTVGGLMPVGNIRATRADTNMPGVGQLPLGHEMLIYSLQVIPDEFPVISGTNATLKLTPEASVNAGIWKWRKIFHQTLLSLEVEQTKSFVEGRLDHFPMGGGLSIEHNAYMTSTDDQAYILHNGTPEWSATRRLAMPIHIGSLETFTVTLDWPRGGVGNSVSDEYGFVRGFGLTVRLTGPRMRPTA